MRHAGYACAAGTAVAVERASNHTLYTFFKAAAKVDIE
jgi:hypothetical protein